MNVLFLVHRMNDEFDFGTEETFLHIFKVAFIVVNNNPFRNAFITDTFHNPLIISTLYIFKCIFIYLTCIT